MAPPDGEQSAEEASLDIGGVLDELAVEGSGDHEDLRGEVCLLYTSDAADE